MFAKTIISIHWLAAIISLVYVIILFKKNPSYIQKILIAASISGFVGIVAYLMELLSETKEEALLAARFGYVGKCFSMLLLLLFVTAYCDVKLNKVLVNILTVFSAVMLGIILTTPYHNLYYTTVDFVETKGIKHLVLGKGIFYYIFMTVVMGILLSYMYVMFKHVIVNKEKNVKRDILICIAGVIPGVGLSLNFLPILKGYDPTPLSICGALTVFTITVLKFGILDPYQLAIEKVFEETENGVVVVNRSHEIVYANKVIYDTFEELKEPRSSKKIISKWLENMKDNNAFIYTVTKNNVIYEFSCSPLFDRSTGSENNVNGYMAVMVDKTEEYNRLKELTKLKDEAQKANQAKSTLLANMSHEIRTPMNAIMGFADLALANDDIDNESLMYVSYIKSSAKSLLGIINNLLDISKIESGKMEVVEVEYSPAKMFREIKTMMESQANNKKLDFDINIKKALPGTLVGDNIKIREILINIIGNAIKYTKKGSVELIVDVEPIDESRLKFIIHVKDTGIGIKEENLEKIFSTFEQVDNKSNYHVEGSGLGLSIAREMAELMGGKITVQSEYGVGSDFCFEIIQSISVSNDLEYDEAEIGNLEMTEESDIGELQVRDVTTLIVDDNKINLMVEEIVMKKYGMKVDIAESGREAIEKSKNTQYDLILMDQMMPEMDGIETMHAIRKINDLYDKTPIIMVTANAIVGVEEEMLEDRFDGFVTKPIEMEKMRGLLLQLLPKDKIIEV